MQSYDMKKWWEKDESSAAGALSLIRTKSAEERAATKQALDAATEANAESVLLGSELQQAIAELAALEGEASLNTNMPARLAPGEPFRWPHPFKPPGRKVRVLCLHGYSQNAGMLHSKSKKLRQALGEIAQLIYVDAPFVVKSEQRASFGGAASSARRCFWQAVEGDTSSGDWKYHGCEESITYLQQIMRKEGPIDAILGFSQGAVIAHLLVARQLVPDTVSCVICISGFASRDLDTTSNAVVADGELSLPSLHVIGQRDAMVDPKRSEALARRFSGATVLTHGGGHFAPQQWPVGEIADFLRGFFPANRPSYLRAGVVGHVSLPTTDPLDSRSIAAKIFAGLQECGQIELERFGLCEPVIKLISTEQSRWQALRATTTANTTTELLVSELLATALSYHVSVEMDPCNRDQLLADLFVLGWALRVHPTSEEQTGSYDDPPHAFFLWMLEFCVLVGPSALAMMPLIPLVGGHWRDLTRLGILAAQRCATGDLSYLPIRRCESKTQLSKAVSAVCRVYPMPYVFVCNSRCRDLRQAATSRLLCCGRR